jgi:hypothetical protein
MGDVLVLDRTAPRRSDRASLPAIAPLEPRAAAAAHQGVSTTEAVFRSPGLALLAAVSILEGYRWLGVIPVDGSRLSLFVFGRVGAAGFAGLALASAVALTGAAPRRRTRDQWLVVALASLVVMATCALAATASGDWARYSLGAADLALATASGAALIVVERGRRAERQGAEPATGPGISDHAESGA